MFVLILILVLCVCLGYWLYRSILSPMFMFNIIWLVTLVLYQMKWSLLQNDLNERCILCIWLCVIGFNAACIIMFALKKIKLRSGFKRLPKLKFNISLEKKIRYINYLIIILLLVEALYSGGFPLIWIFLKNGKTYFDFGIPSLNGALYGLIMCMGAYSLFKKTKHKYLYLFIGVLVVSRQIIMSMVIEGIIVYLFQNPNTLKNIDKKKVFLVGVIAIVFFGIYGNIRTGKEAFNYVFEARENYQYAPTIMKWIYAYMCFAINNFNNLVNITLGNVNKGGSMINELLPTVLVDKLGVKNIYSPYYLEKINFNVSTYLPSIYLDFGLLGIFVFNFLIGIMGSIIYRKHVNYPCTKYQMYYAVYIHNILLLLFMNGFLNLSIVVQFFYIWIIFSSDSKNSSTDCCFLQR